MHGLIYCSKDLNTWASILFKRLIVGIYLEVAYFREKVTIGGNIPRFKMGIIMFRTRAAVLYRVFELYITFLFEMDENVKPNMADMEAFFWSQFQSYSAKNRTLVETQASYKH